MIFAALLWCAPSALQAQDNAQTAEIGGRFMLEDHNGKIVTDQDFDGRYLLITFGYTYCPDVCPTNLANMSNALVELGDKAEEIAPIFITVDPARDTAKRLHDYVASFDERLIGLTGPQPMIDSVSQRYKIFSEVQRSEGEAKDEYLVDHTASIFLMAPDGKFLVKFAHGLAPTEMAARIAEFM
ncbi:SCO family protein [Magnetovibrio blakemorei]|nr:SCO family protein [Magnetovibrio blakemorei]